MFLQWSCERQSTHTLYGCNCILLLVFVLPSIRPMCISIGCAIGFTIEEIHIKRETSARCALIIAVVLRLPLWKHQMESRSEINNTV